MEQGKVVEKIWGTERYITNTEKYCGKLLRVKPGFVCSCHAHMIKDETFYVLDGHGAIEVNGVVRQVRVGDTIHIPPRTWHCFATAGGMTILEISTHHDDADVYRLSACVSHKLSWNSLTDADLLRACGAVQ